MTSRAGYFAFVLQFLKESDASILGKLTQHLASLGFDTSSAQVRVWVGILPLIKTSLSALIERMPATASWSIALEFLIPRRGGRIDVLLIADEFLFVMEWKSTLGGDNAIRQVVDYALELQDFHEGSRNRTLYPVLVIQEGDLISTATGQMLTPWTSSPIETNARHLTDALIEVTSGRPCLAGTTHGASKWIDGEYCPTPTIIEAARSLYGGHSVVEIGTTRAGEQQLRSTRAAIDSAVGWARENNQNTIIFVTGIPGAGKTLAGLDLAHGYPNEHAAFFSGNGPLVRVLVEALARDRSVNRNEPIAASRREASTFIRNIHTWLDEYLNRNQSGIPYERIVVFDEAQRAWNREHSYRKFQRASSEPSSILGVMSRRPDWAVVVALVGNGQEINTGEAGLREWGRALQEEFRTWTIFVPPGFVSGDQQSRLFDVVPSFLTTQIHEDPRLFLSTSQRSFRASMLTNWVECVLAGKSNDASDIALKIPDYPLFLTRDLDVARSWLRVRALGRRSKGLIASSGARRLKALGLDVTAELDEVLWFLSPAGDVRSCEFLETPATEFGIQGLELDWMGVVWGADFRYSGESWEVRRFVGTEWQQVKDPERRRFALNKYRVLLTRAREGMVVCVPLGDTSGKDRTRSPTFYDGTYQYLLDCGMKLVNQVSFK